MLFFGLFIGVVAGSVSAQNDSAVRYRKTVAMIPMRDGVKLFTAIISPVTASGTSMATGSSPILMERTPYGADIPVPTDSVFTLPKGFSYYNMAKDGYIFVIQDVRGKYKSEGTMQIHQPLVHLWKPGAVDESTDTWDAVDWLVKNVPGNNGKVGIAGAIAGKFREEDNREQEPKDDRPPHGKRPCSLAWRVVGHGNGRCGTHAS